MKSKKILLSLTLLLIFIFGALQANARSIPFESKFKKLWEHIYHKPHFGVTRFEVQTKFERYDHNDSMAKNKFFIFISYDNDFNNCHFQVSKHGNPSLMTGKDLQTYPCQFSKVEETEYRRFFTFLNFEKFSLVLEERYHDFWSKHSYKNPYLKSKRRRHNEQMMREILTSEATLKESNLRTLEKSHLFKFPEQTREFYLWHPSKKSSLEIKFKDFKTI